MSTFYMPPRGAPGSPVFDPDNVRSLLGFFDDLEYCFDAATVRNDIEKKQHATRYAPDSEKTIWRSFPEFTDRHSDYDAFKKAIIKDYIGGSLFSIHDLMSLVAATAKTGISSIKTFGDYSRQFRDIASSLISSGYLRDHQRDHLFLQGIEDSLRQTVIQRLRVTHPFILFPRHQYSIEHVTAAVHHVLESAITPAAPAPSQPELLEATQALAVAKAAFVQLQIQQQFLSQPVSRLSTVPPPAYSPHLSAACRQTIPTPANTTQPSEAPMQPPVSAPERSDFVPKLDYESRLTQMRQQLAALEQQRAAHRAASHTSPSEDHRSRTTDNFDTQISTGLRAASPLPQPEPHTDRPLVVPAPAPPPSRFKLPVVYFATPATPASTTERAAVSPSNSAPPDCSSRLSLAANVVPPLIIHRSPVQILSPTPSRAISCQRPRPPVSVHHPYPMPRLPPFATQLYFVSHFISASQFVASCFVSVSRPVSAPISSLFRPVLFAIHVCSPSSNPSFNHHTPDTRFASARRLSNSAIILDHTA